MRDHVFDTITAAINLVTVVVVTLNRGHIRELVQRQKASEMRERLRRSNR